MPQGCVMRDKQNERGGYKHLSEERGLAGDSRHQKRALK